MHLYINEQKYDAKTLYYSSYYSRMKALNFRDLLIMLHEKYGVSSFQVNDVGLKLKEMAAMLINAHLVGVSNVR